VLLRCGLSIGIWELAETLTLYLRYKNATQSNQRSPRIDAGHTTNSHL